MNQSSVSEGAYIGRTGEIITHRMHLVPASRLYYHLGNYMGRRMNGF